MPADVLLDFLYSDHERVASFLAQLLGSGTPTQSQRTGSKGKTTKTKGGIDLGILKTGVEGERDWNQEVRELYDPLWSNSRRLIEEIQDRQNHLIGSIPIVGQLRIFSGTLLCFDYTLVKGLLSSDAIEDAIAAGVLDNDVTPNKNNTARKNEKKRLASVIREFLTSLPLGIGFVLVTDQAHFWFNVKRDYLKLNDLDIPLKFPIHISGCWEVLGIVDAIPNDHVSGIQWVIDRQIDGLIPPMAINFLQLTGVVTAQFGRSAQSWGLSPLVMYRDVFAPAAKHASSGEHPLVDN